MAIRGDPTRQRFPGITGRLIVDTYRGQVRVRSWPKKRGPKGSKRQLAWRKWFSNANELTKYAPVQQWNAAIKGAKGTGLYPRDMMIKAMGSGFFDGITEDGVLMRKRWDFKVPIMFQGASAHRDTPLNVIGGSFVTVQWPLPDIDTMSFWDISQPTRLTVPTDVEIVQLGFSVAESPSSSNPLVAIIQQNGVTRVARADNNGTGGKNLSVISAPMAVLPGDYFEAQLFSNSSFTYPASQMINFWLSALQIVD